MPSKGTPDINLCCILQFRSVILWIQGMWAFSTILRRKHLPKDLFCLSYRIFPASQRWQNSWQELAALFGPQWASKGVWGIALYQVPTLTVTMQALYDNYRIPPDPVDGLRRQSKLIWLFWEPRTTGILPRTACSEGNNTTVKQKIAHHCYLCSNSSS